MNIPGYNFFRNDSISGIPKHGVGLYVRESIEVGRIFCSHPNTLCIYLPKLKLIVMVVYRPPSNSNIENAELLSFLYSFCTGKNLVLLGDFNLPTIDWSSSVTVATSSICKSFLELFNNLGLTQWVKFPTYIGSGNVLDLVLTSDFDRISEIDSIEPLPGCRHVGIRFSYFFHSHCASQSHQDEHNNPYDWFCCDFSRLNDCLNNINWDSLFLGCDVEQCYSQFVSALHDVFHLVVPPKESIASAKPPWKKHLSRNLQTRRAVAWRNFKHIRGLYGRNSPTTVAAWLKFRDLNVLFRADINGAVSKYEYSLSLSNDPKRLHGYLRQKKVDRPTIGPLLSNGVYIEDYAGIANHLAHQFTSVLVQDAAIPPYPHQISNSRFVLRDFTVDDVLPALNKLKLSPSSGPDGLPSIVFRCAMVLS